MIKEGYITFIDTNDCLNIQICEKVALKNKYMIYIKDIINNR